MRYLLDVNALVAFGLFSHQFHPRVIDWLKAESSPTLLTCSITELGFMRVVCRAAACGLTVSQAQNLLLQLKKNTIVPLQLVSDTNDISCLPRWVKTARQTADGHLLWLAAAHSAKLATLDEKIPGAFLIPAMPPG